MCSSDLMEDAPDLTPAEVLELQRGGALLVDVREADEWTVGHIVGAFPMALSELPERWRELPDADRTVFVCRTGGRSRQAADAFAAANAARDICLKLGAAACLVKGVKRPDDKEGQAVDVFFDGKESHEFTAEFRNTTHTHGSGCTL